jgi:hypothetical protein
VPLLLAAAVSGCGGDDSDEPEVPKAKETIQSFEARLKTTVAAIQQGQCGAVAEFNAKAGYQLPCQERAKKLFAGFKVTGAKTYGSGGVIEFQDAETQGRTGVYTVAIGEDGKYQITGPVVPILEKGTLNEEPKNEDQMDDAAEEMVEAIRANDCKKFVQVVVTPPSNSQKATCDQELIDAYGPLHQQLVANKDAKPERIEGNAGFMFYALRTGDQYRTLIVTRALQGRPYRGFVTFRGPPEQSEERS